MISFRSNDFADLEDCSTVDSIVDVHKSRRRIFQGDQGDFDEKRDGRLSDNQRRVRVAGFHCCETNAGGDRH